VQIAPRLELSSASEEVRSHAVELVAERVNLSS